MQATLTATGQTYPVETVTPQGVYLLIAGWIRFFALSLVIIH